MKYSASAHTDPPPPPPGRTVATDAGQTRVQNTSRRINGKLRQRTADRDGPGLRSLVSRSAQLSCEWPRVNAPLAAAGRPGLPGCGRHQQVIPGHERAVGETDGWIRPEERRRRRRGAGAVARRRGSASFIRLKLRRVVWEKVQECGRKSSGGVAKSLAGGARG